MGGLRLTLHYFVKASMADKPLAEVGEKILRFQPEQIEKIIMMPQLNVSDLLCDQYWHMIKDIPLPTWAAGRTYTASF